MIFQSAILKLPGGEQIDENLKNLPSAPPAFDEFREELAGATPGDIINLVVPLIFVIAGIILFMMLIFGGLTIFTSAGNPEGMKKGQQQIVNALIGLLVIFAAYWIVQLVEYSLGLNLLGTP
ncbi:MAG TPA: pilin [Patescibacteria group bacterium]|nr:pilin [Patescibacteria group bacterium]